MTKVNNFLLSLLVLGSQSFRVRKSRDQRGSKGAQKYVVTLGDSYSSGTGIHIEGTDYDVEFGGKETVGNQTFEFKQGDAECWRELNTTPGPRLAERFGLGHISVACKGAKVADISQQWNYLVAKYPEETKSQWKGSMIILSAGGNDLSTDSGMRWPQIITQCTVGWPYCHEVEEYQPTNFDEVKANVGNLIKQIAAKAPLASIRLMAYPPVMKALSKGWRRCPGWSTIHGDEADWIDGLIIRFNQALKLAVMGAQRSLGGADVKFVPVATFFDKGACDYAPKHINAVLLSGWSVTDASFHPTQLGYDAFWKALQASTTADSVQ